MRIGIDISQTAHYGTGVAEFIKKLVIHMVAIDKNNEYVLFFSSLQKNPPVDLVHLTKTHKNVRMARFRFPPTFLDMLWNKLHFISIEQFIGNTDVFLSSDWVQPPTKKAKKVTILYDLIVYKYPEETAKKIVNVQKRKLHWVKKECDKVICISESTKKDAIETLGIDEKNISVVYPGV